MVRRNETLLPIFHVERSDLFVKRDLVRDPTFIVDPLSFSLSLSLIGYYETRFRDNRATPRTVVAIF